MWVAEKKHAFVYVCLRRCVPAGHSQDSGVSTRDTTRRRRNDVGRGRKGRKTKRRKGREGKNESYRAALDIEFVLSIVLPSIQRYYVPAYATLECNRYQCFDLRTATRSYGGWIFIRNVGERERERRFRRGNRASSYEIPFRESEKGSIKFASYFEFRLETETVIPLFERISYYIASSWEKNK